MTLRLVERKIAIVPFQLLLLMAALQGTPSFAQKQQPNGITIKPVTGKELFVYFGIAATSTCSLLVQDIPFKSAIAANAESVASVIMGLHNGEIDNGKKLNEKDAMIFSVNNIILRVSDICNAKLPQDVQESLKKFKTQSDSKPKP
jgi:hypothetical protein